MLFRNIPFLLLAGVLTGCSSVNHQPAVQEDPLKAFQKLAGKFNSVVSVPSFETTTNEVDVLVKQTIVDGNAALDQIGKLGARAVTFQNTVGALDDLTFQLGLADNRLSLIKETSTNAMLRDAATDAIKELQEWMVGLDYREDVYQAVKAYANTQPRLVGEDARLLEETLRDYRRAGLELPKVERDEVERMRKELSRLTTDFETNVTKAEKPLKFTKAELDGVPEDFLKQIKTGDDEYTVMANITWHYLSVMDNARREETRQAALHRAKQPGPRHEHPAAGKDSAAARRHRQKTGLQNVGGLPNRSPHGEERRHRD